MSQRFLGGVIYDGPSRLDGSPIVVIVTGYQGSANRKTGAMLQSWILRADIDPQQAIETQADASICGDCPHRRSTGGACYVVVSQAPLAVWRAWKRGRYQDWTRGIPGERLAGRFVRFGAYGDPGAVPTKIWRRILKGGIKGHTGYTHQWRIRPSLRSFLMASVDSEAEMREAERRGWRTFRVLGETQERNEREITCPASRGVQCADCRLCQGNANAQRAVIAAVKSITIGVHGTLATRLKVVS